MATLSDTLTMGIVLAVVLGSLFFYLYTRLLQVEKRISLTENILLDLKMATENTLMMMGSAPSGGVHMFSEQEDQTEHVEAVSEAQPLQEQEVEEIKEEDFYKSVLQNAPVEPTVPAASTKMEANYEALTKKELQEALKQRGITLPKGAGRKEMIDVLKKNAAATVAAVATSSSTVAATVSAPEPGSESALSAMDGAELIE
jgi:hypothetical protein